MFTTLKSVVAATVIAAMALAASCSYDDSGINQRVDRVEKDLAALTERVAALEKKLADEVDALSKLINGKTVVTKVEKAEDGATTVTLSDGTSFVVYPECTVVDTDTDTDTDTYLSVKADEGVLYWAIFEKGEFKEWLLNDGKKVPVYDGNDNTLDDDKCDGGIVDTDTDTFVAPYFDEESKVFYYAVLNSEGFVAWYLVDGEKVAVYDGNDDTKDDNVCDNPVNIAFRVKDGNLEFTLDGGLTWTETGLSAADAGAQVITDVEDKGNYVTFTSGDVSFDVMKAEVIEFEAAKSAIYVKVGETKSISFAINDAVEDINIMNTPLGWKASVEAPTRAVGGMDYVLNITAPSKEFAQYAEKNGKIAVHFNTAAGACKVMNIEVNMAELTVSVDKAGNITITNSLLDFYQGQDPLTWEPYEYEDFVTWYIGLVPVQYYEGTVTEDIMDYAQGTYGWNFGVNEKPYVDGEYECQVIETSVQYIMEEIFYTELGVDSYVVFVLPFTDGGYTPVFEDAVTATFKQLNVAVEEVDAYFNDVALNVTFAGAEKYHITSVSEADLKYYDGINDYITNNIMLYFAYDSIQFANTIEEDFYNKEISLRGLIDYGAEPWFSVLPNETYYLIVLPIEDSSVAYTDYVLDDFLVFEFNTADITEAAELIDHTAVKDEAESSYFGIEAKVSYDPDKVDYALYKWYDYEQMNLTKDDLLNGSKVNLKSNCYTNCDGPGQEKTLALLLVNKNGEYSIAQHTFKSNEVVYSDTQIAIESVTFEGKSAIVTITEGEYESIRWYSEVSANAIKDQATLDKLSYTSISGSKSAYENPFSNVYTASWANFKEGNTYFFAVAVTFADGTVSRVVTAEYEYVPTVKEPVAFTSVKALMSGNNLQCTFSNDTDTLMVPFWNNGAAKLADGTYTLGANFSSYDVTFNNVMSSSYWCSEMTIVVTTTDKGQKFEFDFTWNGDEYLFTYEGVVEADLNALQTLYSYCLLDSANYQGVAIDNFTKWSIEGLDISNGLGLGFRTEAWDVFYVTINTNGVAAIAPGKYELGTGLVEGRYKSFDSYTKTAFTAGSYIEVEYDAATGYTIKFFLTDGSKETKGQFVGDLSNLGIQAPAL